MKFKLFVFTLLSFFVSCATKESMPLSENMIQISNQNWEISQKNAVVQASFYPIWNTIYVKLDGNDGSSLFLTMVDSMLYADPQTHGIQGEVVYYTSASVNSKKFRGNASIELIKFDPVTKTIQFSFEAEITCNGVSKSVKSAALTDIKFTEIPNNVVAIDYQINSGQSDWMPMCLGASMLGEQVNWAFYNLDNGLNRVFFNIPWTLEELEYTLAPQDSTILTYYSGNEDREWVLESGKITLENNEFTNMMQIGNFNAIFHHPDHIDQKFQIESAAFKVQFH